MIKNKFCLVGVDRDLDSLINKHRSKFVGYFSNFNSKKYFNSRKSIGKENLKDWLKIKKKFNPDVHIVIDDGEKREKLVKKIFKNNVKNLIFNDSKIDEISLRNLKKKKGIVIQKYTMISCNVKIEDGVRINIGSQIHHDVSLGKYSTVAPSSVILGSVKVGSYAYIGANSTIMQNIKIGKKSIIGAGSVVIRDVKDNEVVAGNPARKIN
jgi:UDP-N-acetylbacillosamine N-acetyltransferase